VSFQERLRRDRPEPAKGRRQGTKEMHATRLQSRDFPAGTFSTKDALDDGNAYDSAFCLAATEQLIEPGDMVNRLVGAMAAASAPAGNSAPSNTCRASISAGCSILPEVLRVRR